MITLSFFLLGVYICNGDTVSHTVSYLTKTSFRRLNKDVAAVTGHVSRV